MGDEKAEACGRCSMTSVVDAATEDDDGDDHDPFGEARIEVPEDQLRTATAPTVALARIKRKVDEVATRLTYGRRR